MWGPSSKKVAAKLTKQQSQFCSSVRDNEDEDKGWGDVDEEEESSKGGWGSPASSQAPTTGWGMKNPKTVVRGWGAAQSSVPRPDLTPELKPEARVKIQVEPSSTSNPPPRVNGWGNRTQTSQGTPAGKRAERANFGGNNNEDGLSRVSSFASDHRLPPPPNDSGQESSKEDPGTQRTRTEASMNGLTSSKTSTTARTPPVNSIKFEGTKIKPPAVGEPGPWNIAKQMAARGHLPLKQMANITPRPRVNVSMPPLENVANNPRAKILPPKSTATMPSPETSTGKGATVASKEAFVPPKEVILAPKGPIVAPKPAIVAPRRATVAQAGTIVAREAATSVEPAQACGVAQQKTDRANLIGSPVERVSMSSATSREQGTPQTSQRKEMFIVAQSETARFQEVILLLENHPLHRPAMLIVDKSRTDPILLSALLRLSGLPAAPANVKCTGRPKSITVVSTDDLRAQVAPASLIVNVNMVDEFDQIGERMKYLVKNGVMKTILLPSKDSVRATQFASKLQDCGLPVPHQLESFLPNVDQ